MISPKCSRSDMTLRIDAGERLMGRARDKIARADRLSGRQIAFDDTPENGARALVQLR